VLIFSSLWKRFSIGIFTLSLTLCFTHQAFAFINVESIRKLEGKGFVGRSGLQASGQMGNTEKFSSQFSTTGAYRLDQNEWLYLANYKYGTSFKIKDTNLGSAHLRHTWGYLNPLAYELFIQSEFDEFKRLNSRNYLGGNLRFRLIGNDDHTVYAGLGSFYEIEDFAGMEEDEEHFRGNIYLSQVHNIGSASSMFLTLYYQPILTETNIYRVRLQAGLDVPLTKALSLSLTLNASHDTGLPENVKKTDSDYLAGFSLTY
jgi:hypothetical protein